MKPLLLAGCLLVGSYGIAQTAGGAAPRGGSGINPPCLSGEGALAPGSTWRARVDTSARPEATWTFVEARARPASGPITPVGELLIDRTSALLFSSVRPVAGGASVHDFAVPSDPDLAGMTLSVQAAIGPPPRLCNAQDLVVGCATPVTARFVGSPTLGLSPHAVQFHDHSRGEVTSRLWSFGDGATSTLANPGHTYGAPGTYAVSLTVTGRCNRSTSTRSTFVSVFDPATQPYDGYTIEISDLVFGNPTINARAELLDLNLQVVHTWQDPLPGWAFAELAKPLDNGGLLAYVHNRMGTPGFKKILVELDWDGNALWQYDPAPLNPLADFERLSSGNTMLMANQLESWPSIHPDPIYNDHILEVDPAGNVVWDWGLAEHWDDLPFSASERAYLYTAPRPWIFHLNSIATLPPNPWEASDPRFTRGNVIASSRETNKVFIIDRQTDAVVWSFGGAIGQHHVRMIPPGLPGAGNILLFDNGGSFGAPPITRDYSRILEVDPLTRHVVWKYEDQPNFFSGTMGSVQRLPSGNTLITEAAKGRLLEIDAGGNVVWTHVRGKEIFRSYRIDKSWQTGPVYFPW